MPANLESPSQPLSKMLTEEDLDPDDATQEEESESLPDFSEEIKTWLSFSPCQEGDEEKKHILIIIITIIIKQFLARSTETLYTVPLKVNLLENSREGKIPVSSLQDFFLLLLLSLLFILAQES